MSAHKHGMPYYKKMLALLGSLSSIFSNNPIPYLNYRVAENLFCKAFSATNLSRADLAIDAKIGNVGIGIKTFIDKKGKSFEKIAEFNKDNQLFKNLNPGGQIRKISELRNERLEAMKSIYDIKTLIYHCVIRRKEEISAFECAMDSINISKIHNLKVKRNIIYFDDDKNKYHFNISKSTLYKQFITNKPLLNVGVKIIADPFEVLENKFADLTGVYFTDAKRSPFVILPLYSTKKGRKIVHSRSGLNQWHAGGRKRDLGEVYIPIPIWIHKRFPGFFPKRYIPFKLTLPNENILKAAVCQDNSKALMTDPNKALGKWLLRGVLKLKDGELLTYKKLQQIGVDAVIIEKKSEGEFKIDFRPTETYERFEQENKS